MNWQMPCSPIIPQLPVILAGSFHYGNARIRHPGEAEISEIPINPVLCGSARWTQERSGACAIPSRIDAGLKSLVSMTKADPWG